MRQITLDILFFRMTLLTDKPRVTNFPPVLNLNVGGRHFTTRFLVRHRFVYLTLIVMCMAQFGNCNAFYLNDRDHV